MNVRSLLVAAVALAIAALALTLLRPPTPETDKEPRGGDFILRSADGPLDTRKLRGKVVLIYFGYTYCPDICPTSLSGTAAALKALSTAERAQVAAIFVSVDPERDTPERLKDYAAFFHPEIVGVTGSPEDITAATRLYGAVHAKQDVGSQAGYVIDHSAWTYVVTPEGRLAGRIAHGAPPEQIVSEIRKWLPAHITKGTP